MKFWSLENAWLTFVAALLTWQASHEFSGMALPMIFGGFYGLFYCAAYLRRIHEALLILACKESA